MANNTITAEVFNKLLAQKKNNEEKIVELYANYENFVFSDRLLAADVIQSLKAINFEFDRAISEYRRNITNIIVQNTYTVIQGDTLPKVAFKITGDTNKWRDIYKANDLNDLVLSPGDVLLIPGNL